tara:strand:+ start:516 stop:773 length:258 start_codon:yes stop_codon:yes gene_type:complete
MEKIFDIDYIRMNVSGYEFVAKKGLYTEEDNHATIMGSGTACIKIFNVTDKEILALERLLAETEAQKAADCAIIQHKINKLRGLT